MNARANLATLREMRVDDLDAVMAAEVQAYGHPWSRGNFTDSLAAAYEAWVLEEPVLAAGRRAELLGYWIAQPGVDELHLLNLTVAPAHQRRGHARTLLAALQARARHRGLATIWLEVRASNEGARALYRQWGFEPQGQRRGYYPSGNGQREDAVVMSLRLDAAGPGA